jgi:group I intron endonuclease
MVGIYKITSPTGKIYIGQSTNIENRFKGYEKLYCKTQTKLYNSLKKYGWKAHQKNILEECNESQLLEKETYWKNYYKVLEVPSLCCRIDGKGGKNHLDTNQKISQSNKGTSRNRGRKQSEEEKIYRSQIRKGYQPTFEHLINMSNSMKGKNTRSIICINDNQTYSSIKEASSQYNLKQSSIDNILSGRAKKTQKEGLIFKYINF